MESKDDVLDSKSSNIYYRYFKRKESEKYISIFYPLLDCLFSYMYCI